jgi:AcrR family transcriptional regulator
MLMSLTLLVTLTYAEAKPVSESWTEEEVPDQEGHVAVIAGANTGLGFENARALAASGATVVLGCRDVDAGKRAAARIGDMAGAATDGDNSKKRPVSPSRYHHGDLKAALIDGAIELIAERGVRGFSLAELSRRAGVTVAAPYRHFTDRDELLAAVGVRALDAFGQALAAGTGAGDLPERRVAVMVRGYVVFAAEQRPLFEVLFGANLDKTRFPELRQAWQQVDDLVDGAVQALCPDDAAAAAVLGDALEAIAHGHAMLLLDGTYGDAPGTVQAVAGRAANAARALIAGRAALVAAPASTP